jgi:predicted O-methyltransferase YrrM
MSSTYLSRATKIDGLAHDTLLKPNPHLDAAIKNSTSHGLPPITVSPLQGQFLAIQAQLIDAKRILEIGALGGYSSIWMASTGAHVTSIEISQKHKSVAEENIKAAGLSDKVNIIRGAALDVMPKLHEKGEKFDMVFIDADWGEQWEYFDWAVKMTRARGLVYVDNVVRTLLEDGVGESGDGKGTLLEKVGNDERVTSSLVSTVSSHKGREDEMFDGFLIAAVKGGHHHKGA